MLNDFPLFSCISATDPFLKATFPPSMTLDCSFILSKYTSNLTRCSYFHLRCLRAICKSVSTSVFAFIVHAVVGSLIDYCNSLLNGLPKVRLFPLNASAWLIAHLPRVSHISSFMTQQLNWPLALNLKFFSLFLTLNSVLLLNTFVIKSASLCPLRSSHHHDLSLPCVRSTMPMAQTRFFASISPSLWNRLPVLLRSSTDSLRYFCSSLSLLKSCLFPGTETHQECFCLPYAVRSTI